jgi:hypothetical protein
MRKRATMPDLRDEDREFLKAMASDVAADEGSRDRARAVLAYVATGTLKAAASKVGVSPTAVRKAVDLYNSGGWRSLLTVLSPRGGDFLSRYDQGYWAERLVRAYLDSSRSSRAIPYGTSRSEPFTDLSTFREYATNEFLLQAWSAGRRWKRPDLLLLPRSALASMGGNDMWTPDLKRLDNDQCASCVAAATAAAEVETSLWQVAVATVDLSFTVKAEDLQALRAWVSACGVPLYVVQVFYDEAHALPFSRLEELITGSCSQSARVEAEVDRTTKKATYRIPLGEGVCLGHIPEPDVEGRVYKAPNGRVTVYGRLTGSQIIGADTAPLELLVTGELGGHDVG